MFGSIVITVFNNQSNILGEFYEKSRPFNYNLFLLEKSGYVGYFFCIIPKILERLPLSHSACDRRIPADG